MSYPRSLDEIPSDELAQEILRRNRQRRADRCPYCNKKLIVLGHKIACTCRFGDVEAYHPNHILDRLQYSRD